jgi:hypothetical protein
LNNLPDDLAETYIRVFNAIPQGSRPFVRQVLLWVSGHTKAAWFIDRGINVNLLLSAVAYDLYGTTKTTVSHTYDVDLLKELCGCLITIIPGSQYLDSRRKSVLAPTTTGFQAGKSWQANVNQVIEQDYVNNESDSFVSLAHYTVTEFLYSPLIYQTPVFFFALSNDVTDSEFTKSVLRQAIQADPADTSADWVYDREAYCLTLVPALTPPDIEADRLFLDYLNPKNPHFRRIYSIQKRIMTREDAEQVYYLRYLPFSINLFNDYEDIALGTQAKILLNLLALGFHGSLIERLFANSNVKGIINIKLSATWLTLDRNLISQKRQEIPQTFVGTIPDIMGRCIGSHPDYILGVNMKTALRTLKRAATNG